MFRPLAGAEGVSAPYRARRDRAGRERLYRDVAEGPFRRRRGPAGKPEGAYSLDGGVREPARFPRTYLAGDGHRQGRRRRQRLGHVGLTRARKRAKIYFATNRRMHGTWSSNIPSRFLDELPEQHVEVTESKGGGFGMSGYGPSRFDEMASFGSSYGTPGWQRAQASRARNARSNEDQRRGFSEPRGGYSRPPLTIEGELVARSTGEVSEYGVGDRVFHQKFGNGNVVAVDGNKLTIAFDKAGEKRVVDSFVERV